MKKNYQAKAPGSLMLTGEHAVLKGYPALVFAVDQFMKVSLTPRKDEKIYINSEQLGLYESAIEEIQFDSKWKLLSSTLLHYQEYFKTGFEIEISSDFPSIGLGSSGALLIALLAVFQNWLFGKILPESKYLSLAIHIIQQAQGVGSGADAAASLLGGMIYYQNQPLFFKPIKAQIPLTVVFSGTKVNTVDVLKKVEKTTKTFPDIYDLVYQSIGECSHHAVEALEENDWKKLGKLFNLQHSFMQTLSLNTEYLDDLIQMLREDPGIWGAKISGAGLGDCVIGLGHYQGEKKNNTQCQWIQANMTSQGLSYE
jgi:mevalonate kinase